MTHSVPSQCPLCGQTQEVTEVACGHCDTQMRGHFTLSRFDRLAPDQAQFLETFLRCRGVIRDVEAALGISYPTVRARLDALLGTLGLAEGSALPTEVFAPAPPPADKAARRKEILAAISAGTLDAETGLNALQDL